MSLAKSADPEFSCSHPVNWNHLTGSIVLWWPVVTEWYLNWAVVTVVSVQCEMGCIDGFTNINYTNKCVEKSILISALPCVTVNHLPCITAMMVGHIYGLNFKPLSWGYTGWGMEWAHHSQESQQQQETFGNPTTAAPCFLCLSCMSVQKWHSPSSLLAVTAFLLPFLSTSQSLSCVLGTHFDSAFLQLLSLTVSPVQLCGSLSYSVDVLWAAGLLPTWSVDTEQQSSLCGWGWQNLDGSESRMWRKPQSSTWPTWAMSLFVLSFADQHIAKDKDNTTAASVGKNPIPGILCSAELCQWSGLCRWRIYTGCRMAIDFITQPGAGY